MSIGYFQTDTEMLCNNVGTSFGVGMTAASEGNERMVGRIRKVALINGGRQGKDSSMLLFLLNYAEDTQEGHDHVWNEAAAGGGAAVEGTNMSCRYTRIMLIPGVPAPVFAIINTNVNLGIRIQSEIWRHKNCGKVLKAFNPIFGASLFLLLLLPSLALRTTQQR